MYKNDISIISKDNICTLLINLVKKAELQSPATRIYNGHVY